MNKQETIDIVIKIIENSKNIETLKIEKLMLIERMKLLTNNDVKNDDMLINPDACFSKMSLKQVENEIHEIDWVMKEHTRANNTGKLYLKNPEYGINLLRCCHRCTDYWLEQLFTITYLKRKIIETQGTEPYLINVKYV